MKNSLKREYEVFYYQITIMIFTPMSSRNEKYKNGHNSQVFMKMNQNFCFKKFNINDLY